MKYYFQRPPQDSSMKVEYKENTKDQSITFNLFKKAIDEKGNDEILDSRTFLVKDIFVENFYALVPIQGHKIMEPVNMDPYRGQVGVTENLKKVYQYDDFICYLIFGDEATLAKTSVLGLYNFGRKESEIKNANQFMDFYSIVALSVDDSYKIRLDAEKRKTLLAIAPNEILSGLEAQVDVLSVIVLSLIEKLSGVAPDLIEELADEAAVEEFKNILQSVAVTQVKTLEESLAEMRKQKTAVRKEQKRYFERRQNIAENL